MALAKKCDRCGKLYELKDIDACGAITNGLVLVRRYKQNARSFSYKYFDLCPECLVSLSGWLKNEMQLYSEKEKENDDSNVKEM